jgi:hypothetical protein
MFVSGQDKSPKARRLVGHFARPALCWTRVRREPLIPYRRQSEDYRETALREIGSPFPGSFRVVDNLFLGHDYRQRQLERASIIVSFRLARNGS